MNITPQQFRQAADEIGCDVASIVAVATVESNGGGFDPDHFPITLFEGHWFYKMTNGQFATSNPNLCYKVWTRQFYGKSWREEKTRLQQACLLNRNAALMSASWGLFQIMGVNYPKCGFSTIQDFVNAMCKDEGSQLEIFVNYVKNSHLDDEIRDHRWADFARLYNGPQYAQNQYDIKLKNAYEKAKLTY